MNSMDFKIHNGLKLITMNTVLPGCGFSKGDGSKLPKFISTQIQGIHENSINGQYVYIM